MLYTKDDKKYVEMCKIFDEEFYSEERDDAKLYKYAYLIFYMLACKENYFKKFEDYDGYAQFAATTVYVRFIKKQGQGERVKSILNYAKSSKGFLKIMYQNQAFDTVIGPDIGVDTSAITDQFRQAIQSDYRYGLDTDVSDLLETTPDEVRDAVNELVYSKDPALRHKVYLSALLTLLDNVTLSNKQLADLRFLTKSKKAKPATSDELIGAFEANRSEKPITWCLGPGKGMMVRAVVNRARQRLSESINDANAQYSLPDDVIDSIMATAYTEGCTMLEEDDDYE